MNIAIIGTGYVGLVTGTCFAEMGNRVCCVDINEQRIINLKNGVVPIFEPGLNEMVIANMQEKRLSFTTSYESALAQSEICFIAVGTPPNEDGTADVSHVLLAAKNIGERLVRDQIVVNKSTVPVGTCDLIYQTVTKELQKRGLPDRKVYIADNPEFLKEGAAVEDFMRPDRVIIGAYDAEARDVLSELYSPFVRNGHPIYFMDVKSAELTKYAANAMLASRISFMNEIAALCDKVGADISMIRQGIGSDKRIGMSFLYAGLGYGGSCFPKDVKALINMGKQHDVSMPLISGIEETNASQREKFLSAICDHFSGDLQGRQIAVWGLAFKPLTDDMREAPSVSIIKSLCSKGAMITAYDPKAKQQALYYFGDEYKISKFKLVEDMYEAVDQAEALLLLTEWRQFRQVDFSLLATKMRNKVIFDGRNQYDYALIDQYGFCYYCLGRNKKHG